jgi:hypothetical protein
VLKNSHIKAITAEAISRGKPKERTRYIIPSNPELIKLGMIDISNK